MKNGEMRMVGQGNGDREGVFLTFAFFLEILHAKILQTPAYGCALLPFKTNKSN